MNKHSEAFDKWKGEREAELKEMLKKFDSLFDWTMATAKHQFDKFCWKVYTGRIK
jgi:hypothetical protein